MTPEQSRIMLVGLELDMLNRVRERRQAVLEASYWDGRWHGSTLAYGPAQLAAFIMATALIDQRRRALRALLADALEAPGRHQRPGFEPMFNNAREWAGRHRQP